MRVLVLGASGTIGSAVVDAFREIGDEVIGVSRSTSPSVDMTDPDSINSLFESIGTVDAVVSATGKAPKTDITQATAEAFSAGFGYKLGGQINLVLSGLQNISDGGSFTLTTGILAQHRVPGSVITGTVNGALESFVQIASPGLPRNLRINAVSPTIVLEPGQSSPLFPGFKSVTPAEAAQGYVRSVHGVETGQIFRIW